MDIQLKQRPWYLKYLSYIIAGALLLALIIYLCVNAFSPRRVNLAAERYKIAEASESPFLEYIDVEGIVHPIQTIQFNALESGFVERIVAEDGAMLNAGDTILVISNLSLLSTIEDDREQWLNQQRNYREQEIEMEQRSITLRRQVLEARHHISSLEKSLRQSREEYRMGIKSKAELDVAEEDYDYQVKSVSLQIQGLDHDSVTTILKREMIEANREASARKFERSRQRIDNLIVRAPISGQLSRLDVNVGQPISAGASLGEIKVLTEFKINVSLPEYYIDRISVGLPASVRTQDSSFPLRISKVVPEVKDRTFPCDLLFTAEKPSSIRLGKSYRVQIELAKPETALVIPRGDFFTATSGHWIYRLSPDGKTAVKTDIEIGRQNPQQCEITSGLQPGDRVIVSGYDKLGDSDRIAIK